jgi:O-antigen polysaccharide polymerase Wzy-like protein
MPDPIPNRPARRTAAPALRPRGRWTFLLVFIGSCFIFWWLRSILVRSIFHVADTIDDSTLIASVLALGCFIAGYLIPTSGRPARGLSDSMLDGCEELAYKATIALFFPALLVALDLLRTHAAVDYGSADPTPRPYQAVLYIHLFFGFMAIGAANPARRGYRRIWIAGVLLTLPRMIVSLHGARFFLAQALVPVLLIAIARGWVRLSGKRVLQLAVLALFIIFVPAMTRGDQVVGPDRDLEIFMGSDVLGLFQNNIDLSLNDRCPPLLISLTAKTFPYGLLGMCVIDIGGLKNMPATLERILTDNDPGSFHGTVSGTGSNYLLELYVTGGMFAVYVGSMLFGFTCRRFVRWIGARSLFAGIWAECLTRALLAPRGNLGYVYERIPSLVLATLLLIAAVASARLLKREYAVATAVTLPALGEPQ